MTDRNIQLHTPRVHRPLTEEDRATFVRYIREGWGRAQAARMIRPHTQTNDGAYATFKILLAREPEFKAAVEEAQMIADEALVREARRRAVEGVKRPVVSKGEIVTYEQVHSDRLLEMLIKGRVPEYNPTNKVEMSGSVDLLGDPSTLQLTMADLALLSHAEQEELHALLSRISERRPRELDHQPYEEAIARDAVDVPALRHDEVHDE